MEPSRCQSRLLNGWQLSKLYTFGRGHQSFALAADELSLSPSAVSHRINQRKPVGNPAVVRSHRKVGLPMKAKRVFWALKSSLDTLNQEILDIQKSGTVGTLTVYSVLYRPVLAVPALGTLLNRYQVNFSHYADRQR